MGLHEAHNILCIKGNYHSCEEAAYIKEDNISSYTCDRGLVFGPHKERKVKTSIQQPKGKKDEKYNPTEFPHYETQSGWET